MPSAHYARIVETARTGLLLVDRAAGAVLQTNPAFLRMTGLESAEVVGRRFWQPPLIADAESGDAVHRHLSAGGTVESVRLPLQARDRRWLVLEISGHPLGEVIQLEVDDATAREQAGLLGRMELLRAQAVRTSVEFANLHHTLRRMGQMLMALTDRGRSMSSEMEELRRASERASVIAAQLRAFSGGIACDLRTVAVNDLIESLLPNLHGLFGQNIELLADLIPGVAPVRTDPAMLRQIILKLAANSNEALGRGGTFCLQTRNALSIEPGLGSAGEQGGPYVMLAVSDNGPGMDDRNWEHLYEPFFTTKAHRGGLGLGLAAVHGMVRQIGGRLWVYSEPGKGVLFRIYLPQAR